MSVVAVPIGLPYFTTGSPERIAVSAILCPLAIGSRHRHALAIRVDRLAGGQRLKRRRDVIARQ